MLYGFRREFTIVLFNRATEWHQFDELGSSAYDADPFFSWVRAMCGHSDKAAEMLAFRQMKTEQISCSGDSCTVLVTIRGSFNPGAGERIAGGLTAWISPEQRSAYLSGRPPAGEQAYRVQITYRRRGNVWRAVEFDRAPVE